jgi:hypothetical protein
LEAASLAVRCAEKKYKDHKSFSPPVINYRAYKGVDKKKGQRESIFDRFEFIAQRRVAV